MLFYSFESVEIIWFKTRVNNNDVSLLVISETE